MVIVAVHDIQNYCVHIENLISFSTYGQWDELLVHAKYVFSLNNDKIKICKIFKFLNLRCLRMYWKESKVIDQVMGVSYWTGIPTFEICLVWGVAQMAKDNCLHTKEAQASS